ncbi:MAG: hypothetical protein GF344_20580 [Chitinivibrionales bacterium]|nr:hypothetical protein [Chitinivibrionales bacterium]MBD3358994.1 hypothetical protein [Chitinivibrionales bacterium]
MNTTSIGQTGKNLTISLLEDEHELILKKVLEFDKAFETKQIERIRRCAEELYAFLRYDMMEHFALEEDIFFAACCLCIHNLKTARLVLRLQKEHGYFARDGKVLMRLMEKQSLEKTLESAYFMRAVKSFMDKMLVHLLDEDQQLVPHIKNNRVCRQYIGKLAAERQLKQIRYSVAQRKATIAEPFIVTSGPEDTEEKSPFQEITGFEAK